MLYIRQPSSNTLYIINSLGESAAQMSEELRSACMDFEKVQYMCTCCGYA